MREALIAQSRGECDTPMPMHLAIDDEDAEVHIKSSYRRGGKYFALKLAGTFPHNTARGLSTGNGAMLLGCAVTGAPAALLADGGHLTDVRTAAVAAMTARELGRTDCTIGGVTTASIIIGAARGITPGRPSVRSAPARAYSTSCLHDEKAFNRGRGAAWATSATTRQSTTESATDVLLMSPNVLSRGRVAPTFFCRSACWPRSCPRASVCAGARRSPCGTATTGSRCARSRC